MSNFQCSTFNYPIRRFAIKQYREPKVALVQVNVTGGSDVKPGTKPVPNLISFIYLLKITVPKGPRIFFASSFSI
jgi:hypothetical protein